MIVNRVPVRRRIFQPELLSKKRPLMKYCVCPTVPPYSMLGVNVPRLPP
jgi:hypothetical protein